MSNAINPESTILKQLDEQWQRVAMLLLWKTSKGERVEITVEEIEEFHDTFAPGIPVLFTHGMVDRMAFQIVDEKKAAELAAFDAAQRPQSVQ